MVWLHPALFPLAPAALVMLYGIWVRCTGSQDEQAEWMFHVVSVILSFTLYYAVLLVPVLMLGVNVWWAALGAGIVTPGIGVFLARVLPHGKGFLSDGTALWLAVHLPGFEVWSRLFEPRSWRNV